MRHVPCGNFRKDVVGLSLKTPTVSHADNRCLYVGLSPSRLLLWAGECGTCVNTAVHSLLSLHIVAPRRTCLKPCPGLPAVIATLPWSSQSGPRCSQCALVRGELAGPLCLCPAALLVPCGARLWPRAASFCLCDPPASGIHFSGSEAALTSLRLPHPTCQFPHCGGGSLALLPVKRAGPPWLRMVDTPHRGS